MQYALSCVVAAATLCVTGAAWSAEVRKPNILFIVGDDMGYGDAGFQGCKDIQTPNLDSLAKMG